ncbi:hypothetical protein DPMN_117688 [Dreissena polymorpha]|uniref:Uncharacterized protein n=1 Tax=Dreissena polymorpha TaxID=45954 RepID=A0A9D4GIR0_DREPO|nr:hypothetical protein DPMN_117688 [Dreissena polymorpha]
MMKGGGVRGGYNVGCGGVRVVIMGRCGGNNGGGVERVSCGGFGGGGGSNVGGPPVRGSNVGCEGSNGVGWGGERGGYNRGYNGVGWWDVLKKNWRGVRGVATFSTRYKAFNPLRDRPYGQLGITVVVRLAQSPPRLSLQLH